MLLHALAIALFGAPSGGSREGRALWGSLQVVLQGSPPEEGPMLRLDRHVRLQPRVEPVAPPKPSPPAELAPVEKPFSMPKLIDRIPRPDLKLERRKPLRVPPPTEVQHPPAPVTPAPSPTPPEPPAPNERLAPRVDRVPTEAPLVPAPLLQPVPLPSIERLATPPPLERAPVETAVVPATVENAPVHPEPPVAPVHAEPPVAPQREAPARIERAPPPIAEPALRTTPFRSPSIDSIRPREGESPTTYDPTAPSLDADALRKRAASISREGTGQRALLPFLMPPIPEHKTKEQIAIEKARKPDCRTAYQELGLAAVVPLIANEFGEGTCRW